LSLPTSERRKAPEHQTVKLHHPGAGSDPEQFHRIQRAYDQAIAD
jgi:hypothetical protein